MSLQERLRRTESMRAHGHDEAADTCELAAAELDRLQARAAELGELLCELREHPAAGPFTDAIEPELLRRWQEANDAAIDTARKAKP